MDPVSSAGLELIKQVVSKVKSAASIKNVVNNMTDRSMIDIANIARVEPLTIVDYDCSHLDYLSDITQSLQSIFSGYYLQAISLLGVEIGGITIARKLSPLNPSGGSVDIDWRAALETYIHKLPKGKLSLESAPLRSVTDKELEGAGMKYDAGKKPTDKALRASIDKEAVNSIHESANLSIGKMYNVTIKAGEQSAVVPVSIRLLVNIMPTHSLVNMMTFKNSVDTELVERWHGWRSGRLSLIGDLLLCNDLIDAHRKALLKDNTGVYEKILTRENRARRVGLINKTPSVAIASNLAIISSDTADQIERQLGNGKLKTFKARQEIFKSSNLMVLVVVDKQWERVTFYYRGIDEATTLSIKDIKAANKGSGSDVADIMKAFLSGASPTV
jgi:hypothetical protein